MGYQVTSIVFSDETVQNIKPWWQIEKMDTIIITIPFSKKTPRSNIENRLTNLCSFIRGFKGQLFLMSSIGIYPNTKIEIKEDTYPENLLQKNLVFVERTIQNIFHKPIYCGWADLWEMTDT